MAIRRAPRDIGAKFVPTNAEYRYERSRLAPIVGSGQYNQQTDYRPSYAYGTVVTLPGGDSFRKSTFYTHESWEVNVGEPARISGTDAFGRTYTGYDFGRDLQVIDKDKLVGITKLPQGARNEAVTKALNDLADQKVNLGENLATLGQTVRMFSGKASFLVQALKKIRDKKEFRKHLFKSYQQMMREGVGPAIANAYLEYIYGLKPLMSDIYELSKIMKEQSNKTLILSGKGKAQRTVNRGKGLPVPTSYSYVCREEGQANYKVKCKLYATIDPNWTGTRSLNELGLINPLSLTWELVPWSFVVDWLIPIGPVLQALSAPAGLSFIDGSISMRVDERSSYRYECDAGNWSYKTKTSIPAFPILTYNGYRRDKLSSWPMPGFYVDHDPLRGDRLFKALALSITSLGNSKRDLAIYG